MTVSRNGATWTNSDSLFVGSENSAGASLQIGNGGVVTVGSLLSIHESGQVLLTGGELQGVAIP